VNDETLANLFEAARWAPSSRNEQPWRFVIVKKEDSQNFSDLLSCLHPTNQVWAKNASALILVTVKKTFSGNETVNAHAYYDAGQAVANLSLQATADHLYLRQMGGIDKDKIITVFNVPPGFGIVCVIAAGYPGNPASLPDYLSEKENLPRTRKATDEFVFSGKFGKKIAA